MGKSRYGDCCSSESMAVRVQLIIIFDLLLRLLSQNSCHCKFTNKIITYWVRNKDKTSLESAHYASDHVIHPSPLQPGNLWHHQVLTKLPCLASNYNININVRVWYRLISNIQFVFAHNLTGWMQWVVQCAGTWSIPNALKLHNKDRTVPGNCIRWFREQFIFIFNFI